MGGPTAHPTGVTLASGDPSNSLTARWSWGGSRPRWLAAPLYVLEAECGHWHAPAGGGGVEGRGAQGSWTRSGLLHRRGSSVVGDGPVDGGEGGGSSSLRHNRGRCGVRER